MTRIRSDNVQVGGSFVVPIEQSLNAAKIKEALGKEQEIIANGEQKAREIIEKATIEAKDIIQHAQAQAMSEVEEIKEQGFKEGFEAGFTEGNLKVVEEMRDKLLAVDIFAKSDFEIKKAIIKSAHLDIINLVVELSKKVCSNALETDENVLKELTLSAIQSLKDKESINIIINPEMAEKIYSISEDIKEKIPQLTSIKIIEDPSVSPDGTIVESPLSRVDSRISSQINELYEKLMAKLNSTPDEELIKEVEEKND